MSRLRAASVFSDEEEVDKEKEEAATERTGFSTRKVAPFTISDFLCSAFHHQFELPLLMAKSEILPTPSEGAVTMMRRTIVMTAIER